MISEIAQLGPLASWMFNFFCFSSVMIGAVWAIDRLCPHRWGMKLESAWKLVIPISFVAATLLLNPAFSDTQIHATSTAVTPPQPPAPAQLPTIRPSSTIVGQVPVARHDPPASAWSLAMTLLLAYFVAVLFGLWRLLRDFAAARQVQQDARVLHDNPVLNMTAGLASKAKVAMPCIKVGEDVNGPSTFLNNTICLPQWALDTLNANQLKSMLAHEVAHIARKDVLWSIAIRFVQIILPFQPLLSVVKKRVSYHAELACDDWAALATGKPRALAQTLGHCAEILLRSPAPALAAGMADSQLVARVRRLTNGQARYPIRSARTLAMMAALSLSALAIVPGIALSKPESGERSVEVVEDDSGRQRGHVRLRNDERKLSFKYEGEIEFNKTFDDVASLDDDGVFKLSDRHEGIRRDLELEVAADGSLERDYEVDGRASEWNQDAREWFADIVQLLVRETGMALEQRLDYLLANGGSDSVIDELALIKSDYVMRQYVVSFSSRQQLETGQLKRMLGIMQSELQSDYEQRTALTAVWVDQSNAPQATSDLLGAAQTIQSDYEARVLAEAVAQSMDLDEASVLHWLGVVETIQSDFEMRSALASLLQREDLHTTPVVELLEVSHKIQSDFELRTLLEAAAHTASQSEEVGLAYVRACGDVQSDFEMRMAVTALVEAGPYSDEVWLGLINLVRTDISGHEAAETLIAMAPGLPADAAVQAAFERAKDKLSKHNQERVAYSLSSA